MKTFKMIWYDLKEDCHEIFLKVNILCCKGWSVHTIWIDLIVNLYMLVLSLIFNLKTVCISFFSTLCNIMRFNYHYYYLSLKLKHF